MTSKTPEKPKKPVFSAAFNHALGVVGGLKPHGVSNVAEEQAAYTPPPTSALPPKKPVKDKPAS